MSKKSKQPVAGDRKIDIKELEQGLRSIKDDIDSVKESASGLGIAAGVGFALILVLLAFIIGRRRGKQKYAFVEVRRA
jgi:hypothetical protein